MFPKCAFYNASEILHKNGYFYASCGGNFFHQNRYTVLYPQYLTSTRFGGKIDKRSKTIKFKGATVKSERYEKIMNILAESGYASVDRLSEELFVSMPTVRRDLNTMQDLGLVVRSHGGVALRLSDMDGGPTFFRMGVNSQEKLRLDKAAAKLLRDNCMVFMDESTTTLHIIDQMSTYKNITVVTNSISVLQLAAKYRVPTICLGGETCYDTMSFYGYEAEELITHFGIDIMFYSSSAITSGSWIADYSAQANALRRRALQQADMKVFLCDKSKFLKPGAYMLMPLCEADHIITNSPLPHELNTGAACVTVV